MTDLAFSSRSHCYIDFSVKNTRLLLWCGAHNNLYWMKYFLGQKNFEHNKNILGEICLFLSSIIIIFEIIKHNKKHVHTALLLLISYCILRTARKMFTSRYVADDMVVGISAYPLKNII